MEIKNKDYLLGVWRTKSEKGEAILIAKRIENGPKWEVEIKVKIAKNSGQISEKSNVIPFNDNPTYEVMLERIKMLKEVGSHFYPDSEEGIETKCNLLEAIPKLADVDWITVEPYGYGIIIK